MRQDVKGREQLAQSIRRGREAVARARANGADCSLWERRLAELKAQETALVTSELLATRGWCLWQCESLDGQVIAVARNEVVVGPPPDKAVFTEAELVELFREPAARAGLLKLVIEAKKMAGARVLRRESKENGQRAKD